MDQISKSVSSSEKIETGLALRALVYLCLVVSVGLFPDLFVELSSPEYNLKVKHSPIVAKTLTAKLDINNLTDEDYYQYHKDIAINDFYDQIKKDFKPSQLMKKRVGFWFDIYAKYDDNKHIIHHQKYPWIVFDVVDVSSINQNKKLHRWTRYHRAKNLVKKRRAQIRIALRNLANRKHYKRLSKDELLVLKSLRKLNGKLRYKARIASQNIRSQTGQKKFFHQGLQRYGQWIDDIESIFKKHRLPLELTRIPFVESSYNPKAVSKVGASGVWQLMPAMGRKFLRINKRIDERNDPIKAARAAALLLKENKMLLKKWPIAVTAYNTGAGMMRRAMKKTRSKRIESIISRFKSRGHGFAAKNFYASFVAALHVEQYNYFFFPSTVNNTNVASTEESVSNPANIKELKN